MRWFKHLTATHRDEKIARMLNGPDGHRLYGFWWLVLEVVAENFDGRNPSVTYPIATWSHLLVTRGSLVMSTLLRLPVTVERHDSEITVTIPNLLKYRDEYTQRTGQTRDSVPPKKQIQIQKQNPIPIIPSLEPSVESDRSINFTKPENQKPKPPIFRSQELRSQPIQCCMPGCGKPALTGELYCSDACRDYAQYLLGKQKGDPA